MSMQVLPHDLFHSDIIPDLLSDYLHRLLVHSEHPEWNPFYTLPLVSRKFHTSCCTLFGSVFGPLDDDEMEVQDIINDALSQWSVANLHPARARAVDECTEAELKSTISLIQVYSCAALAKSYLNLDVLWHIDLERRRIAGEFDDADDEDTDVQSRNGDNWAPLSHTRRFKMRDDNMHRLFLPLTCAIQLCDRILPERLAYIVADYLAEMIPRYCTAPVLLKYAQDLEVYVSGEHKLPMDILLEWINQTLRLAEGTSLLLQEMQDTGTLVQSFRRSRSIPFPVLEETNILHALDRVAAENWGEGMAWINEYARDVKMRLQSTERRDEPS